MQLNKRLTVPNSCDYKICDGLPCRSLWEIAEARASNVGRTRRNYTLSSMRKKKLIAELVARVRVLRVSSATDLLRRLTLSLQWCPRLFP